MRVVRRLPVAIGLVLASALANALAFPPWSLRPLAFVSLVPLLLAIRSGGWLRAALLALLWGELWSWAIASVFPASLGEFYARSHAFGVLAGSLVFLVMSAVYYAGFAVLHRAVVSRPSAFAPLLVAAAWVTIELLRGRLFTGTSFFIGNPWGLQGYTHASGALAQIASITGVYGISFTLVAVNAGLAGLIAAWPHAGARRIAFRGLGLALLPVVASALYGSAQLRRAPDAASLAPSQDLAIVQGNVSVDRRWRSDFHGKNLDVYLGLTREALRRGEPRLVLWPETALNFFVEAEPGFRDAIAKTLRDGDASLLVGGPSGDGDKRPPYFNSVFHMEPDRGIVQRYDKELLVPFSEYFPAASFGWMRRRLDGARSFRPGAPDPPPLETPLGRAGILICNEAMLPEIARRRVLAGAEILISPSNDSWIAGRAFGEHMLAVVALRAIEFRRYLARASTAGPSAVIDPWGRVVARSGAARAAVLFGGVLPRQDRTPYTRLGDAFAGLCALVTSLCVLRATRRRWHARSGP